METLLQDLRFALRMLAKGRGVTFLALLALAFGIGANTAIFSVVNTVLLRPLPYKDPEHLLALSIVFPELGPEGSTFSPSDFFDFRAQNRTFQFAAFEDTVCNLTGGQTPEQIPGALATADFFSTLGVSPLLGRGFLAGEDKPGAERVAVLSEGFWRGHFNADPQILGRSIIIDSRLCKVVGVMPANFQFPNRTMQVWLAHQIEQPTHRGPYYLRGLLRFSGTIEQARAELAAMATRIKTTTPGLPPEYGFISTPLKESLVGKVQPALLVLLGAVGLLLLIAALNVANLVLSRSAARRREISIRAALGASRTRIVRQFLTENLILAFAGGLAGLLLSFWGIDLLRAFGPDDVPRLHDVTVDCWVLGWTALISLGSGILFGIAPAWHGTTNLNDSLKESGRATTASGAANRLRNVLVISEIAIALMLLIGAGLLIRSFVSLQQVHPGFVPQQIVTMEITLPSAKYSDAPKIASFFDGLLTRVRTLPGVSSAALTLSLPPNGLQINDNFLAEGQPLVDDSKAPIGDAVAITPGYFHTFGVPVLQGRDFTDTDNKSSPPVVIINRTLARQFFGNTNPVGKRLKVGGTDRKNNPWMEIVGVVGDVKYEGLGTPTAPAFYWPLDQGPMQSMSLVLRTALSPTSAATSVRAVMRRIDADVPVAHVNTIENLVNESVAQPKFRTFLIGVFSAVALLLAAIGIYGVVAYSITQRTHEIGIRMALGAQRGDVLTLIVRQGLVLALIGIALGLLGAFGLTRVMSNLLFSVAPTDPLTFAGISLLLLLIAFFATYLPARRAAKLDPVLALGRI